MASRISLAALFLVLLLAAQNPPPRGVIVEEVSKGSEAESAGILVGDLITGGPQGPEAGEIQNPFDWTDFEKSGPPVAQSLCASSAALANAFGPFAMARLESPSVRSSHRNKPLDGSAAANWKRPTNSPRRRKAGAAWWDRWARMTRHG